MVGLNTDPAITGIIGPIPYRMAFAGGWIDQPFLSVHNPTPPGSMVVVRVKPQYYFMERCGMGTSTRNVAMKLWRSGLPAGDPVQLVRQLYRAENDGLAEPSGSQDMAGIIYPGVSRLDYDYNHEGGFFPVLVESNTDPVVTRWLEGVIHVVPVAQRPAGYNPLGIKNLDPEWIGRLGQTGRDCFNALVARDTGALGASMNDCMTCWETILPNTVRHPALAVDLMALLRYYQSRYTGAMYSGSGGGYLYVVSEETVPGAFRVTVQDDDRVD